MARKVRMSESEFWELVEAHVQVGPAGRVEVDALESALAAGPPERIVGFAKAFAAAFARSYRWDLWGAAYLVNGGCSDDGFDAFRGWLIARGREVFERALADPDSLAGVAEPEVEAEEMFSVADRAYEAATGQAMPPFAWKLPDLGPGWDFDDPAEMSTRYPRLWERFG